MKKLFAAILAFPMGLITACGSENEAQKEENKKNHNTVGSKSNSEDQKIQKLKDLGVYTETRMRPGGECDDVLRECHSK